MEEGEQRAKELAVMFIETSAKTSYNVKQVGGFKIGFDFEKQHKYFFCILCLFIILCFCCYLCQQDYEFGLVCIVNVCMHISVFEG